MKKIYIFDEVANSAQNGIGTYIAGLKKILSNVADVTVLSFNDNVSSFRKEMVEGVRYYRFPPFCSGHMLANSEVGMAVLRMEISDSEDNVFILNYFLCNELLKSLKESYPLSQTVFVVHDQTWTETLLGDENKLRKIVENVRNVNANSDGSNVVLRPYRKEKEMYQLADKIITMNKDTLSLLKGVYQLDENKIFMIPHGRDINLNVMVSQVVKERLKKEKRLNPDDQIILYVGRTTQCKGFYATLSAFERLCLKTLKTKLVILGKVCDIDIVTKICVRSKPNVIIAGQVGKDELQSWYQLADVGLVPSYCEQCGYVGIEMLANGIPIVASDGFGVKCMFKHGYNALVAKIGNREDANFFSNNLAHAIEKILKMSNAEVERLRTNARQTYLDWYTMPKMRRAYSDLFVKGEDKGMLLQSKTLNVPEKGLIYNLILHCNDIASNGLLDGKIGIVLSLMEFAYKYNVPSIKDFCICTINKCVGQLSNNIGMGFASGISGIGWAIDYLRCRGFIDTDTKEICSELDKRLMLYSVLRMTDLSLERGFEGLLRYVNLHVYNNDSVKVFDKSFLNEIISKIERLSGDCSESLNEQALLFKRLFANERIKLKVSLLPFVKDIHPNNLTLSYGQAGKLAQLMNCN